MGAAVVESCEGTQMNDPKMKKHARDRMSITGLKYQAARRAMTDERQRQPSIDSGFGFRDFVTPRELRTWLFVNHPKGLYCHRGRHFCPTEMLGQCVGCGMYIEVRGNPHQCVVRAIPTRSRAAWR